MDKNREIKFPLLILISFFLHLVFVAGIILPDLSSLIAIEKFRKRTVTHGRDIIVNINQNKKKRITKKTLLSDRDSIESGFLTKKRGDRWLNNALNFNLKRGTGGNNRSKKSKKGKEKIILSNDNEVVVTLSKGDRLTGNSDKGKYKVTIPDKNDISRKNAIFYSNDGSFSFNTSKFKHFKYFKNMKDKIASNWAPPVLGRAIFGAYNPVTNRYSNAPGYERYNAIPGQHVKLYFILDKMGNVVKVEIVDSFKNKALDASCIDSIRLSKNFGQVPKDILKGDVVVIRFIFGYYLR